MVTVRRSTGWRFTIMLPRHTSGEDLSGTTHGTMTTGTHGTQRVYGIPRSCTLIPIGIPVTDILIILADTMVGTMRPGTMAREGTVEDSVLVGGEM